MMNTAQELCQTLDCELGTAVIDNMILQPETFMLELLDPCWNSTNSEIYRHNIEHWVIENGVTDATYFYLGQLISDALQVLIAVKQIPKIIRRLGPALANMAAMLSGAGDGMQLSYAGVAIAFYGCQRYWA